MNQKYTVLLSSCIQYVEAFQHGDSQKIEEIILNIKNQYNDLASEKSDLFEVLFNAFDNDNRLYTLIMSSLYLATNNTECLNEIIKYLIDGKMELFDSMIVKNHVLTCIFKNYDAKIEYSMARQLHKNLLDRYESLIEIDREYVKIENRNKKRIVIVIQQLLSELHAPTRVTLEICSLLQNEFGFEVIIIVALDETDIELQLVNWANPSFMNYIEEYNGKFIVEYNNTKIQGFQLVINKASLDMQKSLINEICLINPFFVWAMGDNFLFADQFRRFTTVVTQRFIRGFPITEASVMLLLEDANYKIDETMKKYLEEKKQNYIPTSLTLPIREIGEAVSRDMFGIKKDSFLIAIIGNRLNAEMTKEFIELLGYIAKKDETNMIRFLFVGTFNEYNDVIQDSILKNKSHYIGFQKNLLGILGMCDAFLNLPRKGGGTGAVYALSKGIPVITLDNCDVSLVAGEQFICKDDKEIFDIVFKYLNDNEFYEKQCKAAKQKANSNMSFPGEIEYILNQVAKFEGI